MKMAKKKKIFKIVALTAIVLALCAALAFSACEPPIKVKISAQEVSKFDIEDASGQEGVEGVEDGDDFGYTESGADDELCEDEAQAETEDPAEVESDDEDFDFDVEHDVWETENGEMTDTFGSLYTPVTDTIGDVVSYKLTYVDTEAQTLVIAGVNGMPVTVADGLTEGTGAAVESLVIDDGVIEIGDYAFSGCASLTSVDFGDEDYGVRLTIGEHAFEDCTSLTEVEFAENVESIGDHAFYGCTSLASVKFAKSSGTGSGGDLETLASKKKTASVGGYAFSGCKAIESVTFGESYDALLTIGDHAFSECTKISELDLSTGVESIGTYAFLKCSGIKTVTVGEGVEEIGLGAFGECYGMTSLTLPYAGAHAGARYGEAECVLGHIFQTTTNYGNTPSNAVKTKQVFANSSDVAVNNYDVYFPSKLASVTITGGDTVDHFFYNCKMLTEINLPESINHIGERSFYNCTGITEISIADGVTEIGDEAFSGCSGLTEIKIPAGVTSLGYETFYNCTSLACVGVLENVTELDSYVFYKCSALEDLSFSRPLDGIGAYAFSGCSLWAGSVEFSDKVTSIPNYAFKDCASLKSVKLPDSLESIGGSAFYQCYNLTNIVIPKNVTSIGSNAFYHCYKLVEVYNLSELDIIAGKTTNGYVADYAFAVHTSLDEESRLNLTDDGYMFYDDESDGHYFMGYFGSETDLVLPQIGFAYEIYEYAFYDCATITSIVIPEGVTVIEQDAFYGCTSLEYVVFPASLTSVMYSGFSGCTSLTAVYYAGTENEWKEITISSIGNSALSGCTIYYYSESEPQTDGNFWHYDGVDVAVWPKKDRE